MAEPFHEVAEAVREEDRQPPLDDGRQHRRAAETASGPAKRRTSSCRRAGHGCAGKGEPHRSRNARRSRPRVDGGRGPRGCARRSTFVRPMRSSARCSSARAVALTDPAGGGTAGVLYGRDHGAMRHHRAVRPKIIYRTQGQFVTEAVAKGEADLGVTFTSEIIPNKGAKIAACCPRRFRCRPIMPRPFRSAPHRRMWRRRSCRSSRRRLPTRRSARSASSRYRS